MTHTFLDHIDQRVRSLRDALPFYDALMEALGMQRITNDDSAEWAGYAYEDADDGDPIPTPFFGLIPSPGHRTDETRIAFAAPTRADVDRIADAVRRAGAKAVEGPEICAEYSPRYYAVFFEDQDGNHFEVCCRQAEA